MFLMDSALVAVHSGNDLQRLHGAIEFGQHVIILRGSTILLANFGTVFVYIV